MYQSKLNVRRFYNNYASIKKNYLRLSTTNTIQKPRKKTRNRQKQQANTKQNEKQQKKSHDIIFHLTNKAICSIHSGKIKNLNYIKENTQEK